MVDFPRFSLKTAFLWLTYVAIGLGICAVLRIPWIFVILYAPFLSRELYEGTLGRHVTLREVLCILAVISLFVYLLIPRVD